MAYLAQMIDGVVVHKFELSGKALVIGRDASTEITIDDMAVSGLHAKIIAVKNPDFENYEEFFVEDLSSTNGTDLNGEMLQGRQKLHNGDIIKIAWNAFKFVHETQAELEKTYHLLK